VLPLAEVEVHTRLLPSADEFGILALLFFFLVVVAIPAYEVGKRRHAKSPGLAFIPVLGPEMVILASIGTSMWWAVLLLVPYIGAIVLGVWLAFVVPPRHGRSRWWTAPFLIPFANLIAFYAYAFTLRRLTSPEVLEAPA
jgi:hypothetical protein